jgi:hypothetical protein
LSPNPANGQIYSTTTNIVLAPGRTNFVYDELVFQGPAGSNIENATFVGTVLSFDPVGNVLQLINTTGTITVNAPLFGNTSSTSRTILNYTNPDFVLLSGYVLFLENRSGVQRSPNGIEQIKFVLGY